MLTIVFLHVVLLSRIVYICGPARFVTWEISALLSQLVFSSQCLTRLPELHPSLAVLLDMICCSLTCKYAPSKVSLQVSIDLLLVPHFTAKLYLQSVCCSILSRI